MRKKKVKKIDDKIPAPGNKDPYSFDISLETYDDDLDFLCTIYDILHEYGYNNHHPHFTNGCIFGGLNIAGAKDLYHTKIKKQVYEEVNRIGSRAICGEDPVLDPIFKRINDSYLTGSRVRIEILTPLANRILNGDRYFHLAHFERNYIKNEKDVFDFLETAIIETARKYDNVRL